MTGTILVVVALAGLLLAQFAYYAVLYQGQRRQAELKRRLHAVVADDQPGVSVLKERRLSDIRLLARVLDTMGWARSTERLLLQTDLRWSVATLLGLCVLTAGGSGLILWAITQHLALAILGALVLAAVPVSVVFDARRRRSHKLSSQLPDAIDMMVRSLRAGHGLGAALRLVAEEMPLPVAIELGRCFEEQRLGVGTKDAMRNMALRMPENLDLKIFAVSVIINQDTGGNLVEVLEQIATTIRDRFRFYGKLRALTIEAKLSGIILSLLPFICLTIVAVLRPGYLAPLAEDPIGRGLVIGGVVLWVLGALSMRRMARVDY